MNRKFAFFVVTLHILPEMITKHEFIYLQEKLINKEAFKPQFGFKKDSKNFPTCCVTRISNAKEVNGISYAKQVGYPNGLSLGQSTLIETHASLLGDFKKIKMHFK